MGFLSPGLVADTTNIEASEAISAGDFVNFWNDGGTTKVRKADGATSKEAVGYVIAGFAIAETALVYHEGSNDQVTGLTPSAKLRLSVTVPGGVQETGPIIGAGAINQPLGIASSATKISVEIGSPIYLSA